jgi:hypothetical protein
MADIPVTNKKTGETEVFSGTQHQSKHKQSGYAPAEKIEITEQKKIEANEISKSVGKVEPTLLFDCVAEFYSNSFSQKKLLDKLNNPTALEEITSEQLKTFFNFAVEKDNDLKKTRFIAECLTSVSCYNKEKYAWISNLLECVFVEYVKPKFGRDSVLSNSNYNEKELELLCIEIKTSVDQLKKDSKAKKDNENEVEEKTLNYAALENNLILIAFSSLHYNEKTTVIALLNVLSKVVFNVTKESKTDEFIVAHSLAFAFTNEGKKNDFVYFLNVLTNKVQQIENQLRDKELQIESLNSENKKLEEQLQQQKELTIKLEAEITHFKNQTTELQAELEHEKELAKHERINLKDITYKTKGQFLQFLESDFLNMLIDVQKGLERTPPKIEVATSYLEIVIRKIEDQIKCLK